MSSTLYVEVAVPIDSLTGETGATGTADAVVCAGDTLHVHDLKYGMRPVEVVGNRQLLIYAAGMAAKLGKEFARYVLHIHQPRIGRSESWEVMHDELMVFAADVRDSAEDVELAKELVSVGASLTDYLYPTESGCKYCRAKNKCPALAEHVAQSIGASFDDLTKTDVRLPPIGEGEDLARKRAAVPLIEVWVAAVCGKAQAELEQGREVPGFKLVPGKRGARKWADADAAEQMLKKFRIKVADMYDLKLVSPAKAEKILGEKGTAPSERRWAQLGELIVQEIGKPTVVPDTDKRKAIKLADPFEDLTGEDMV